MSFNLAPGASLGEAVAAIEAAKAELQLPASIETRFEGAAEAFRAVFATAQPPSHQPSRGKEVRANAALVGLLAAYCAPSPPPSANRWRPPPIPPSPSCAS